MFDSAQHYPHRYDELDSATKDRKYTKRGSTINGGCNVDAAPQCMKGLDLQMATRKRSTLRSCLMASALFFGSGTAMAATNPTSCSVDTDCLATPECGGDVCTYAPSGSTTCTPAGTGPKGADGWCNLDTDCKCYGQGAKCNVVYCTFTTLTSPTDGGAGGIGNKGGAGSGGGAGAAGREGNTGGTSGTGTGSGGGCNIAGQSRPLDGWLGAAAVALFITLCRRRLARK